MGIFDGILGGQSGLTHTTTTNTTNPNAPTIVQAGQWVAASPAQLQNIATVNPNTWNQAAYTPFGDMQREIDELRYILQRTVANYDELLEQHKALQDIANAERNER